MLRSALTSVSKVNKTDVEGLRTSFGVRSLRLSRFICPVLLANSFSATWGSRSRI